jgi:hypothetical protein
MLLGYKNLEEQGVNPVEIPPLPQDLWVYTSSFSQAEKNGELAKYFQSMRLDKECAEAIQNAKTSVLTEKEFEQLIKEHGTERVGWVLAKAVANSTVESLSKYKDWATEKKLPNEPHVKTVLVADESLGVFINKHQAYIRKIREQHRMEQQQFNQKPTFTDRFANAREREINQNQNRVTQTTVKKSRNAR